MHLLCLSSNLATASFLGYFRTCNSIYFFDLVTKGCYSAKIYCPWPSPVYAICRSRQISVHSNYSLSPIVLPLSWFLRIRHSCLPNAAATHGLIAPDLWFAVVSLRYYCSRTMGWQGACTFIDYYCYWWCCCLYYEFHWRLTAIVTIPLHFRGLRYYSISDALS